MTQLKILASSLIFFASAGFAAPSMELVATDPCQAGVVPQGIRSTPVVWQEMFDSASSEIDLEEMNLWDQPGQALSPIIASIRSAAQRGVRIRILVDAIYFQKFPDTIRALSHVPNIETKIIDYQPIAGAIQHAKFFIVDGQAFVGSQNFDWRSLAYVLEVGVRFEDPVAVENLRRIFEMDWPRGVSLDGGLPPVIPNGPVLPFAPVLGDPNITLVTSPEAQAPSGIPYTAAAITKLLDSALSSIHIQLMDYSTEDYDHESGDRPWTVLDTSIRNAAQRGVKVDLVVDKFSLGDGKKALQSLSAVPNITVKQLVLPQPVGIEVRDGCYAHAKYLVVDGARGWLGSENWSEGYFLNAREAGLVLSDSDLIRKLEGIFSATVKSPYALDIPQ